MQLRIDKKGLEAIFQPWHIPLVDELFRGEHTTVEAHQFIVKHDIKTHPDARNPVSRASVIYFLSDLNDLGLLDYTEYSGKGGWGRRYRMNLTREEFNHKIIDLFVNKLSETFPQESLTFTWPQPISPTTR